MNVYNFIYIGNKYFSSIVYYIIVLQLSGMSVYNFIYIGNKYFHIIVYYIKYIYIYILTLTTVVSPLTHLL